MLRNALLTAALILSLAISGCTGKPATTTPIDPPKAPEPAPTAPTTPVETTAPTTPATPQAPAGASPVSSTVSVPDEPWITAPASVSALPRSIQIKFSGPVDKASVEAQLKTIFMEYDLKHTWQDDQALDLNFNLGCANFKIGFAGAKDAQGKELDPALNPVLDLHMPCHGDGVVVVNLSGKERPDIPIGTVILDTDPNSGWLLARNGTIFFLIASDSKTKKPLAHTSSGLFGRFLPDGKILLGDGNAVRVVSQHGEVQRTVELKERPVNGAISPDGKSAVVLLQQGAVHLNLTTWEVKSINDKAAFDRDARLNWGGDTLLILPRQGKTHFTINLKTGDINFPTGVPQIYSPNGQWVIDPEKGGVFATTGERIFDLTDKLEAGKDPYAIWAPDSHHVFFPGGQVINITTGKEVAAFSNEFPACKPYPWGLGKAGADLIATYVVPCH
jgi:hypothetical protein